MILLNCATRILGGDQSPQYNKDIKILQESESQWEDKLTPEIVCEIIPIILNNLANQGNDNVDFTLFEHHYNFCRGANVDSYSIFLRSWAELLILKGERDEAYKKCCEYIYNTTKGTKEKDDLILYSFRGTSDYVINDIEKQTLSFQSPTQFNDPLDTRLFRWLDFKINKEHNESKKEIYYFLKRVSEHLRVRCFVKPPNNESLKHLIEVERIHPLMWAHYAESHRGMCIQYRFKKEFFYEDETKLSFRRVRKETYTNISPDLSDSINISEALFTKSKVWEYEDEVRILDFDMSKKEDVKLQENNENVIIEAIYFGYYCNEETKNKVSNAIRNTSIKLFQMIIEDKNLYQLKAKRLS
jgi:hypothetical protein